MQFSAKKGEVFVRAAPAPDNLRIALACHHSLNRLTGTGLAPAT
jgi:hypothetical protein